MSSPTLIRIRFTGANIQPQNVSARELADVIAATEEMVATTVSQSHPALSSDELIIGLVGVDSGSISLTFQPQVHQLAVPALEKIGEAIQTANYSILPNRATVALQRIASFARKHECEADFLHVNGVPRSVAVVTAQTEVEPLPPFKGQTTIYGELVRIGGAEPKARVRLLTGDTISCKISRELARDLAPRLYTEVGLQGIATWSSDNLEIESFDVISVLDYQPTPLTLAFDELRKLFTDEPGISS